MPLLLLVLFSHGIRARDAESSGPLIAVFPQEFPPIYTVTKNGLPSGFGIEFMEKLARETGAEIHYRSTPTWFDALGALENGKADLIPNLGITVERRKRFDFSVPVHTIPVSIFVRRDTDAITGLSDLTNGVVGTVRANVGVTILDDHTEITQRIYPSLNDLYVGLLTREVVAAVYPRPNFMRLALELGTEERIKVAGEPLRLVQRAVAVRKGDTGLLEQLNPAIKAMLKTRSYRQMLKRWFPEPPPFWNTQRVAVLLGLTLVLTAVLWQRYRVSILGRLNRDLAEANSFSNAILDAASEGILSMDARGNIVSVNDACEQMFNMDEKELVGRSFHWLISGPDAKLLADSMRRYRESAPDERHFSKQKVWECAARRADGELFPVRLGMAPMDLNGRLNFVCTLVDESRARQAEMRAQQLLDHDPLTGVLNLNGISEELDKIINGPGPPRLACLCTGMQRLTYINGVYGRRVGDQILIQTTSIIQEAVAESGEGLELIGRIGGERFLVVTSCQDIDTVTRMAEIINNQFSEFHVAHGDEETSIQADVHIGIACFPEHGKTTEELIYHAELAFYYAREMKLEPIHIFNHKEKTEQFHAEHALQRIRSALHDNRVVLHYQPIKHIASGTVSHFEGLVRIHDTDGSLVMPDDIIPPAERSGLITRLDYRVLEIVMSSLPSFRKRYPDISIAVNLSAAHLGRSNLFAWLKDLFESNPGAAASLVFEITESAALQNIVNIRRFMHELKEYGCRFSLDDFGVGFTSFAQLRNLPVDIVKIDGMFVRNLPRNEEDQTLVKAITEVAHSFDKQVVAEFVEDGATYDLLAGYGVDYAQGYFIGRPNAGLPD